ncbi:N-acetyltransferase [Pelagivirga sediminicola]|uniref:N-acetyltransferase n=1 Tax=Pelagivirga sediminicola TaxID=2170575 RepID=A0A2T7G6G3_9RHOB|nr:GNAT family N-acetyltransferase [Pelagivirga sediminicola]PVA09956.1 N-acetyltransferase [Pelagivirga sediminicola]
MSPRFPEFSRDMRAGEEGAVDDLLTRAYGDASAARVIGDLRRSGLVAGEVVLPYRGTIVGYYALSRMQAPDDLLCVGPMAIDPDWQRAGHGRRLIGLLAEWARLTKQGVIAKGPQGFFLRAGFRSVADDIAIAGPERDLPELRFPAALGR